MGAEAVQEADRGLGVRHSDVHVQSKRRLAASDPAHGAVNELVAPRRRDPGVLVHRARVHARDRGREPEIARVVGQPRAQAAELRDRTADGGVGAGVQLERPFVSLGRAVPGELVAEHGEHLVGALGEHPGAGIEEHHLLLETDRVRRRRLPIGPAGRSLQAALLGRDGRLVHGGELSQSARCCPP